MITLPKITHPEQVTAAEALDALERKLGLPAGIIPIELMIETPQSIFSFDGTAAPPALIEAGKGRVGSAHFGTYDYTASLDITAAHQHMAHPACDFAKDVLKVSLAGTGVRLSDGATNIMPIGDKATVHAAWRLHYEHVRHSLETAYYQGWDRTGQLPTRYAAVFTFFMEGLDAAAERLRNFVGKAAQATLVGDVFDDAATGQGLLNYSPGDRLRRDLRGGGSGTNGAHARGLPGKSFLAILKRRAVTLETTDDRSWVNVRTESGKTARCPIDAEGRLTGARLEASDVFDGLPYADRPAPAQVPFTCPGQVRCGSRRLLFAGLVPRRSPASPRPRGMRVWPRPAIADSTDPSGR